MVLKNGREDLAAFGRHAVAVGARDLGEEAALEATRYVFVLTTVPREQLNARDVLELFRGRWQIEVAFKRLKSVMGLGHLPKYDDRSCRAWLHGKLLVALLAERLLNTARAFSPWGYDLPRAAEATA